MLDDVLRKLYGEIRSRPTTLIEASAPAEVPTEQAIEKQEIKAKPVYKTRKKPQKSGQIALDLGDGQ